MGRQLKSVIDSDKGLQLSMNPSTNHHVKSTIQSKQNSNEIDIDQAHGHTNTSTNNQINLLYQPVTFPIGTRSTADKNKEKRERNKMAARRCRQRKMDKITELKETVETLINFMHNTQNSINKIMDCCLEGERLNTPVDGDQIKEIISDEIGDGFRDMIGLACNVARNETAEGTTQLLRQPNHSQIRPRSPVQAVQKRSNSNSPTSNLANQQAH